MDEQDFVNITIEEVLGALILSIDSPLDSWVLDLGASFHSTPH